MDGSIRLSPRERNACLKTYRLARSARRALILLLLSDEHSYRQIGKSAYASPTLIAAVKRDFHAGGLARVLQTEQTEVSVAYWLIVVVRWLLHFTPQHFGFFRSRWSFELLAWLLREREGIRRSPETVRRGMQRLGFVWRRPRPVLGRRDPEHATKLRQIQRLIAALPQEETAVFQDEVDVHLNPKIGSCWMVRGQQAEVLTPGNNEKRHLAGSLHWRTGRLLLGVTSHAGGSASRFASRGTLRTLLPQFVNQGSRFSDDLACALHSALCFLNQFTTQASHYGGRDFPHAPVDVQRPCPVGSKSASPRVR